jgi:O-antigen ligase
MPIDNRQDMCVLPDGPPTAGGRQWFLAATVFGLMVAEGCREGGFWPADAFLVAVVSVVVLGVAMVLHPPDRRSMFLVGSVVTLALWWLVRSISVETAKSFLPLGASILGFGAAFVAVRPLRGQLRDLGGLGVGCLGAAGSLIGFAGLVWRWYPIAMPAQSLWRLSTTLTYSDAAGLVLAMCLLVAMGVTSYPPLTRVTVCLCAGGLLATQSRGAYVAFACACLLVPWRRYLDLAIPLAAGIALGAAAIVSSPEATPVPWLAAVVVITCAISAFASSDIRSYRLPPRARVAVVGVLLVLVVATAAGAHHEIGLRALAPSDQDRGSEWSAALDQWRSAPLLGVGPDRLLTFHASDGTFAHFAHNEYLQIAADAGFIGVVLLGAAAASAARAVRRVDVLSSCAVSALVCFAVGGAFDFDWHLSFVGLLGGWCAGLAARRGGVASPPTRTEEAPSRR